MGASLQHLPHPLSSFIGREHELDDIKRLLASARLVTLTGAGGCGKTRLALEACRDVALQHLYDDGVWWVELAALSQPALAVRQVAGTLSVREQPHQPLLTTLISVLRDKHLLLVLDNCEHLVTACAEVADALLRSCTNLRILATSRENLRVEGEHVYWVPSLKTPSPDAQTPLAIRAQDESVRRFVDRAMAAWDQFTLAEHNAGVIAHICRRLDGMPLALELAAARARALSLDEIAARLDDSLALLTGGSRTVPPRQQTLRATLDWSWDPLSRPEQLLFARLSVFAGGWTLDAAEAICSGEAIERQHVLEILAHLVEQSVVLREERSGETHYRFLEPIRQYAQAKLQEAADTQRLRQSHLAYFLNLAQAAEPYLTSAERQIWLARLAFELDNLRAALEWTQTTGDQCSGLRLAAALIWFWRFNNLSIEGREWLERSLAPKPDRLPVAVSSHERLYRAKALMGAGLLAWNFGDSDKARAELNESLSLFKALGNRQGVAQVLAILGGETADVQGEFAAARPLLEESVRILRVLVRNEEAISGSRTDDISHLKGWSRDRWWLAFALIRLGEVIHHHDLAAARPISEDGLALARSVGDPWLVAQALMILGSVRGKQGDLSGAQTAFEAALEVYRRLGIKHNIAWALGMLGDVTRYRQDHQHAADLYAEALSICQAVGQHAGTSWMLYSLGGMALQQGNCMRALQLFGESLRLRTEMQHIEGIAEVLEGFAGVAAVSQQPARAARLFGAAEMVRRSMHDTIRAFYRAPRNPYLSVARSQLDDATFRAAWSEGQRLTSQQVIDYALTDGLLPRESLPVPRAARRAFGGLTPREREVAALIAQGQSNRAIAQTLVVQVKTVEVHVTHILDKLRFTSRAQIAVWAVSKGLAAPPQDLDALT